MKARLHYSVRDTEAFPGPYTVQLMFKSDGKDAHIATPEEREAGGLTSPRFDEAERDVIVEYPLDLARQSPDVVQPVTVVFLFRQALNPRDDPAVYQEEAGGWTTTAAHQRATPRPRSFRRPLLQRLCRHRHRSR